MTRPVKQFSRPCPVVNIMSTVCDPRPGWRPDLVALPRKDASKTGPSVSKLAESRGFLLDLRRFLCTLKRSCACDACTCVRSRNAHWLRNYRKTSRYFPVSDQILVFKVGEPNLGGMCVCVEVRIRETNATSDELQETRRTLDQN